MPEIDPENRVMTNFVSANTVMIGEVSTFLPRDITKITVVIWLEGNDPDCTDDIMGGEFKLDMTFEILGVSGEYPPFYLPSPFGSMLGVPCRGSCQTERDTRRMTEGDELVRKD